MGDVERISVNANAVIPFRFDQSDWMIDETTGIPLFTPGDFRAMVIPINHPRYKEKKWIRYRIKAKLNGPGVGDILFRLTLRDGDNRLYYNPSLYITVEGKDTTPFIVVEETTPLGQGQGIAITENLTFTLERFGGGETDTSTNTVQLTSIEVVIGRSDTV
jgi:hypothetical protein